MYHWEQKRNGVYVYLGVQCNLNYIMHLQNSFCSHSECLCIGVAKLQTLLRS